MFDAVGFATADVHAFETDVRDGQLDIDFVLRLRAPQISAIAIERIGD